MKWLQVDTIDSRFWICSCTLYTILPYLSTTKQEVLINRNDDTIYWSLGLVTQRLKKLTTPEIVNVHITIRTTDDDVDTVT